MYHKSALVLAFAHNQRVGRILVGANGIDGEGVAHIYATLGDGVWLVEGYVGAAEGQCGVGGLCADVGHILLFAVDGLEREFL